MKRFERKIYMFLLYFLLVAGWVTSLNLRLNNGRIRAENKKAVQSIDSLKTVNEGLKNEAALAISYMQDIGHWVQTTKQYIAELKNKPAQVVCQQYQAAPVVPIQTASTLPVNDTDINTDLPEPTDPETAKEVFVRYFPTLNSLYKKLTFK